jgi:hypothetical protein
LDDEQLEDIYSILSSKYTATYGHEKKSSQAIHNKIIAVDFDGVINSYKSGWTSPLDLPDAPVPGVFKWLETLVYTEGFSVIINSSRCKYDGFNEACIKWFRKYGMPEDIIVRIGFSALKPAAYVTIDDRTINFTGDHFPTPDEINSYKSWVNK